ncbi:hypothetical protein, partial [Candidatus Ichthyocystis sparus]
PSFLPAPLPSSSPPSGLEVDAGILSFSPSAGEDRVRLTTFGADSAFCDLGDESLPPPSSPSISPASSSSYLSSSPSELGLDADVSSSSTKSSVSSREMVGPATEVIVSESGVLVGELTPVCSSEQPIVPITVSSSISISSIGESSTAASSSSSVYVHGLKKALIMKFKSPFEVSTTTSNVTAEPSSSISMSSSVVSGPSSFAPIGVGNVPLVATDTDTVSEDVGVRFAALLNRGLPPSPPAGESSGPMRGGRGRLSSSHRGSAQRVRGRKRKRRS